MPDTKPAQDADDFRDTADKTVAAGVADETAAYDQAMEREHDAEPQDSEDVADSVTGYG